MWSDKLIEIFFTEEFDNYLQQDAHEFLNFLINRINEILLGKSLVSVWNDKKRIGGYYKWVLYSIQFISAERSAQSAKLKPGVGASGDGLSPPGDVKSQEPTWVHEIFQGILTSETRCLNCEMVRLLRQNPTV